MQQPSAGSQPSGKPLLGEAPIPQSHLAVERILAADPVWAAYAIADLQPEMADDCRWLVETGAGSEAVALIYSGLQPPVLFTMGDAPALAVTLERAAQTDSLPRAIYISIREEHLPVVARYYDWSEDVRPMWRMMLADEGALLRSAHAGATAPLRLVGTQAPDVLRLLAHGGPFSPDAFSPAQIDQGVFFGVYGAGAEEQELVAVGGTHIVDRTAGIGAIGNMYTRPDQRRRGHSAAILRAVAGELLRQGLHTIVLNVDQRNRAAQALYQNHGFVVHIPYIEGKGRRHA
jgi:ribosomal protein S18 acetylase RimI-like enzyme